MSFSHLSGWLHLPSQLLWLNPALIERIYGWHTEEDPSQITAYTIYMSGNEDEEAVEVEASRDVEAVAKWMESRA